MKFEQYSQLSLLLILIVYHIPVASRADYIVQPLQVSGTGNAVDVAFTSDSQRYFVAGRGAIRMFDTATTQLIRSFAAVPIVVDAAINSDGSLVASISERRSSNGASPSHVMLWETATGNLILNLEIPGEYPQGIDISNRDGTVLITTRSNIYYCSALDPVPRRFISGGSGLLQTAKFSPSGSEVLAPVMGNNGLPLLTLHSFPDRRIILTYPGLPHGSGSYGIDEFYFVGDGSRFYANHYLRITATGEVIKDLTSISHYLVPSPDGSLVLNVCDPSFFGLGCKARLIDVETLSVLQTFETENSALPAAVSPDESLAIVKWSTFSDENERMFNTSDGSVRWRDTEGGYFHVPVTFTGDREVATVKMGLQATDNPDIEGSRLEFRDSEDGRLLRYTPLTRAYWRLIADEASGKLAGFWRNDLWSDDIRRADEHFNYEYLQQTVSEQTLTSRTVVIGGAFVGGALRLAFRDKETSTTQIRVVDTTTSELSPALEHPYPADWGVFTKHGSLLMTVTFRNVFIWNWQSGDLIRELLLDPTPFDLGSGPSPCTISPDGLWVATFDPMNKLMKLWEVATGNLLSTILCDTAQRWPVFSPDSSLIAFPNIRGEVQLLDVKAERIVRTYSGHGVQMNNYTSGTPIPSSSMPPAVSAVAMPRVIRGVLDLQFSPDSRRLATTGFDGTMRTWVVPPSVAEIQQHILSDSIFDPELDMNLDGVIDIADLEMRLSL